MEINVPLLKHQLALVRDTQHRFVGLVGGFGSGKTRALVTKILYNGAVNAPLPTMIVEPTYPMVRDILVPTLRGVLTSWGLWQWCRYNKSDHNLDVNLPGGSSFTVLLRSADRPDSLAGTNLATVGVDEPGLVDDQAFLQLSARVRVDEVEGRRTIRQLIATGTPEDMAGWFYTMFDQEVADGTRVIRARTSDNPYLPDDYETVTLGHLDEADREKYTHGIFVPPRGRVYIGFDRERHVVETDDMRDADRPFMACDFNVGSMEWIMGYIRGSKGREQLVVVDELVRENTDTAVQASEARAWWTDYMGGHSGLRAVEVFCDATGAGRQSGRAGGTARSDTQAIAQAGFRYPDHPSSNPAIKDRVFSVNQRFRSTVGDEPGILVDRRCTKLIRALSSQGYGKDRAPDKTKGLDGIVDALGYVVHRLWPSHVPRGNMVQWSRI